VIRAPTESAGHDALREGGPVDTGEEELLQEIEALRGRLKEEVGERYERAKIQSAGAVSSRLDDLICRWLVIQAGKRESR